MKLFLKVFALIIASTIPCYCVYGQNNWTLISSKDSNYIYTADFPGSSIKAFKIITIIKGTSLNELTNIVMDVANINNLYPDTKNSKLLKKYSESHIEHYIYNKLQWPFEDRDGVFEVKAIYTSSKKSVKINIKCKESDYPSYNGVVRMTKGSGFWEFKEIQKGEIIVTYQYHSEPGGKLPSWLINSSLITFPQNTILNLRKIILSGKYKKAEQFNFLK